jgi:hypothetical protein
MKPDSMYRLASSVPVRDVTVWPKPFPVHFRTAISH